MRFGGEGRRVNIIAAAAHVNNLHNNAAGLLTKLSYPSSFTDDEARYY